MADRVVQLRDGMIRTNTVILMRNPLNKRLPRELKSEIGKYIVLFIFLAGMISIVSGFIVAASSMSKAYDESFDKYNIEDGNFELYAEGSHLSKLLFGI